MNQKRVSAGAMVLTIFLHQTNNVSAQTVSDLCKDVGYLNRASSAEVERCVDFNETSRPGNAIQTPDSNEQLLRGYVAPRSPAIWPYQPQPPATNLINRSDPIRRTSNDSGDHRGRLSNVDRESFRAIYANGQRVPSGTPVFSQTEAGDAALWQRTIGPLRIQTIRLEDRIRLTSNIAAIFQSEVAARNAADRLISAIVACYKKVAGNLPLVAAVRFHADHLSMVIGHSNDFRFACRAYQHGAFIERIKPFRANHVFAPSDAISQNGRINDAYRNSQGQSVGVLISMNQ